MSQWERKVGQLRRELGAYSLPIGLMNTFLPDFCVPKLLGAMRKAALGLRRRLLRGYDGRIDCSGLSFFAVTPVTGRGPPGPMHRTRGDVCFLSDCSGETGGSPRFGDGVSMMTGSAGNGVPGMGRCCGGQSFVSGWGRLVAGVVLALVGMLWAMPVKAAGEYNNYIVPAKGYDTEIVLVNNDLDEHSPNHSMLYIAYDAQGNVLSEVPDFMATGSRLKMSLSELFPDLNVNDIGFVKFKSSNKNDVWVVYSNGDQRAMVSAPVDGSSEVFNLHFTDNTGYWDFVNDIAKINGDGNVVKAVVNPIGEEVFFDGSVNAYGFLMPNLGLSAGGASFNMKDFFGGSVPEGAGWMKIVSEDVQNSPFGDTVTPVSNLVNNTLFMKVNGESGGAFGRQEAFEELIVPHIAADGVFWWTGLVLNNPNDEDVRFRIQYFNYHGVHLDVDDTTPEINDFNGVLPAGGKLVDLINNFGMPEGASYARVIAEKPIFGGELFGGEPNGKDWPIMAGVNLLLPGTGGYLDSVLDLFSPPVTTYCIPVAESRDFTDSERGVWTGLAFLNTGLTEHPIKIEYLNENGGLLAVQPYVLPSLNKKVFTIKDLLAQGGLSSIRPDVSMIRVRASDELRKYNHDIMVYALQGELEAGSGEHVNMIGVDAVNTSPVDVRMFVINDTVGIDGLEDLIKDKSLVVEDNDTIKSHLIINLRDTFYGEVTGYDIIAVDENGNQVGYLANYNVIRDGHSDNNKLYYVNFTQLGAVDSDTCPYGTFTLWLKVYTRINGVEKWWLFKIPHKTITRKPEQDYDVDAIKGEGWSYEKSKNNLEKLAELVSLNDVLWQDGKHYSYDENLTYLKKLFDGIEEPGNFEAKFINLQDIRGSPIYGNAGAINIMRTDGYGETFFTSNESIVEKWKQFYEVQNQN